MSTFTTPRNQRYFEDYEKGAVFEFGPTSASEAEIIEFAQRFDPQTMHIDPAAAAQGPFHGLIASGWHTLALMMRLFIDHYMSSVASLASPGVDEVRWVKPVRPGDMLRLRVTVVDTRLSKSKPDRGLVTSKLDAIDAKGEVVASMTGLNFIGCREKA